MNHEQLMALACESGATYSAVIATENIPFMQQVRDMCAANTCGKYGTNWMCPPGFGDVAALEAKAKGFAHALVVQSVYQLEDCFDFEGMMAAAEEHKAHYLGAVEAIVPLFDGAPYLLMNAGACTICSTCTYPNAPCRFPDKAIPSVESCGIMVNQMLTACGLKYNNGKDTVSYVGLIFFS